MTADLSDYRARRDAARAYHPSVRPIWTPADSVATAQEFAAELANAERGSVVQLAGRPPLTSGVMGDAGSNPVRPTRRWSSKLFGRSRFRRAAILDGLAVGLLMTIMGALGVVLFAASAKADPNVSDDVIDYAVRYGAGAVCPVLSEHHTVNGVMGVLLAIRDDGFSDYETGQIVGLSVAEYCPENQPLLDRFIAVYGGDSGQVA